MLFFVGVSFATPLNPQLPGQLGGCTIGRKWGDIGQQIAHPNLHKVKLFISHIISLAGNSHLPFQIEILKVLLVLPDDDDGNRD